MTFNEQLNMSEPVPRDLSATPPIVTNNGTNGNGRSQSAATASQPAVPSNITANNHSNSTGPAAERTKPKVNSSTRNYVRNKPLNKK